MSSKLDDDDLGLPSTGYRSGTIGHLTDDGGRSVVRRPVDSDCRLELDSYSECENWSPSFVTWSKLVSTLAWCDRLSSNWEYIDECVSVKLLPIRKRRFFGRCYTCEWNVRLTVDIVLLLNQLTQAPGVDRRSGVCHTIGCTSYCRVYVNLGQYFFVERIVLNFLRNLTGYVLEMRMI